jgi:hypothetical protein
MSDPTRPNAPATATDDPVEPRRDAGRRRRRPARDDTALPVHPWIVWLVAVLMLAGATLLLAGLTWVGAAAVASGLVCVVALIVRARSDT